MNMACSAGKLATVCIGLAMKIYFAMASESKYIHVSCDFAVSPSPYLLLQHAPSKLHTVGPY